MYDFRKVILDTLSSISTNIDELRQAVNKVSEKLENVEERVKRAEKAGGAQFIEEGTRENNIEPARKENEEATYRKDNNGIGKPVMQGVGFRSVTHEYLRNLKNNNG